MRGDIRWLEERGYGVDFNPLDADNRSLIPVIVFGWIDPEVGRLRNPICPLTRHRSGAEMTPATNGRRASEPPDTDRDALIGDAERQNFGRYHPENGKFGRSRGGQRYPSLARRRAAESDGMNEWQPIETAPVGQADNTTAAPRTAATPADIAQDQPLAPRQPLERIH